MNEAKKWTIKPLTEKQIDELKMSWGGAIVPPWIQASADNTSKDLRIFTVYYVIFAVERAFGAGKHIDKLKQIEELAHQAWIAQTVVIGASERDPKHGERVSALISALELAVSELDNSEGFDLFDKETWKD